jgi:DNA-binding NarL/FixJ family response regulator
MNRLYEVSTYSTRLRVVSIGQVGTDQACEIVSIAPLAASIIYRSSRVGQLFVYANQYFLLDATDWRVPELANCVPVLIKARIRTIQANSSLDFGNMTTGDRRDLILVYSDEGVLATGAASLLMSMERFNVVLAESELSSLIPQVERIAPDLILLDLTSEMSLGFFSALRQASPTARIILWDRQFSDELVEQTRELGAICFLQRGHSGEAFVNGILKIASGAQPIAQGAPKGSTRVSLTPREAQLVALLVQGLRNKEIGACLGIKEGTVRIYLTKLFVKVGARDRFELAVFGLKNMNCGHAFWDGHNAFVTDIDEGRARPILRSLLLMEPKRKKGYSQLAKASGE